MRLGVTALLTTLVVVLLSVGCTEKEDKAWEERQKVLLLEYLDRPGVTYGEITVDAKTKSWAIKDYAVTLEYDVYPGVKATIEAKTLTAFGAELEPVTERSLLVKKVVYEGLSLTGPFYGKAHVLCERVVAEDMYGGAEVQKNMLGFVDGIVHSQLYMDVSFSLKADGISMTDEAGNPLGSMQSFAYEMKGMDVSENIFVKQLVVSSLAPGMDSLSVEEVGVKKLSIGKYQELIALLKKYEPLLAEPNVDHGLASELLSVMQYDLQGLAIKNASLSFEGILPPLTLRSAYFDGAFAEGNSSQAWRLEGLKVAPDFMDALLVDSPLFGFPFATYDLSVDVDINVRMDGEEVESMRVAKLAVHDANLGGVSLSLFMGTDALDDQEAPAAEPQAQTGQGEGDGEGIGVPSQPSPTLSGGPYLTEGSRGDGRQEWQENQKSDAPLLGQSGLSPFEGANRPGYFKDIQVTVTDKGILKTIFDIAAVLSGIVEVENAATGGDLFRHGAAVSLGGQCSRFEGDMNSACLNTAKLLSKGGVVEYKLGFDKPLSIDIDPYILLGGVPVSSSYTPLPEK